MRTLTYDPAGGYVTVVDDEGTAHVLADTVNIAHGIYPIFRYPGHPEDDGPMPYAPESERYGDHLEPGLPGHVTYSQDGSMAIRLDPDRLYGRDGTVKGAVHVGDVVVCSPECGCTPAA